MAGKWYRLKKLFRAPLHYFLKSRKMPMQTMVTGITIIKTRERAAQGARQYLMKLSPGDGSNAKRIRTVDL